MQYIVRVVQDIQGIQKQKTVKRNILRQRDWWKYFLLFILSACGSHKTDPNLDSPDKGTINISADESFKPVIEAQVQVYAADHPNAKLKVHYKPEADCLSDLTNDSVRMVIVTRRVSEEERNFLVDSMKVSPRQMMMAYDAIAVII